jgi:hypothetical protein
MSERLALAGRFFGVRERMGLPGRPLILRSKMACFACPALMKPSAGFCADVQAQGAIIMRFISRPRARFSKLQGSKGLVTG